MAKNIDMKTAAQEAKNQEKIRLNGLIFALSFVVSIGLGVLIGRLGDASRYLSFSGALVGSLAVGVSVLVSFLILKVAFPVRTEKTNVSYVMGAMTLLLGLLSYFAMGYSFVTGDFGTLPLIFLVVTFVFWLGVILFMGMETPVFLAFLLGAVLGAVAYVGVLTLFSQQFLAELLKDELSRAEMLQNIQIVYGMLGAFAGAIGSTIARASGLGLKEPYHVEEI